MSHELAPAHTRTSDDDKKEAGRGATASPAAGSASERADDAHLGGAHGEAVDREHRWWSMEEDRRVRRKLDVRILPILFITYLLAALVSGRAGPAGWATLSCCCRTARTSATPAPPA
jgi:hypothetical protein